MVMFIRPDVGNEDIMMHWVQTGLISLTLFLINWVVLYLSALAMFRLKKLHHHSDTARKSEKLAKFSKMVDDVEDMPYLELPEEEEVAPFQNFKTQPMPNKGNIGSFDGHLSSQTSVLSSGGSMGSAGASKQFEYMDDATCSSPPSPDNLRKKSQSRKIPTTNKQRSTSSTAHAALLKTGSLKEVPRGQRLQSPSETSLKKGSSERVAQSAESKPQSSKQQEQELSEEPMFLSD